MFLHSRDHVGQRLSTFVPTCKVFDEFLEVGSALDVGKQSVDQSVDGELALRMKVLDLRSSTGARAGRFPALHGWTTLKEFKIDVDVTPH